jgi:hypothetical protein
MKSQNYKKLGNLLESVRTTDPTLYNAIKSGYQVCMEAPWFVSTHDEPIDFWVELAPKTFGMERGKKYMQHVLDGLINNTHIVIPKELPPPMAQIHDDIHIDPKEDIERIDREGLIKTLGLMLRALK